MKIFTVLYHACYIIESTLEFHWQLPIPGYHRQFTLGSTYKNDFLVLYIIYSRTHACSQLSSITNTNMIVESCQEKYREFDKLD